MFVTSLFYSDNLFRIEQKYSHVSCSLKKKHHNPLPNLRGSSTKFNAIILKHSNAIEEALTIVKKVLVVDVCERCLKRPQSEAQNL
jgi:hypothetical protein